MTIKNTFIAVGILLLAAVAFVSCKKNKNDSSATSPIAALSISHVAPGFPAYDFKINGLMVLRHPLTYGTYLDYDFLRSGKQEFSISPKGRMEVLARTSDSLKPRTYYSVYVVDSASKPALLISEDDLSAPPAGKAKIRFVHLSPDAGSLDLSVAGKSGALFSNTHYRTSTDFSVIDPGAAVKLEIGEAGNAEALSSTTVKIEKNKVYTLRVTGLKATTDTTRLGLTLITNQ